MLVKSSATVMHIGNQHVLPVNVCPGMVFECVEFMRIVEPQHLCFFFHHTHKSPFQKQCNSIEAYAKVHIQPTFDKDFIHRWLRLFSDTMRMLLHNV